jgi:hypothetical protein
VKIVPEVALIPLQTLLHSPLRAQAKNEDAEGLVDQGFMVFDKEVHQRGAKDISSCGKTKEFKLDAMNCLIMAACKRNMTEKRQCSTLR